ncbi:PepSY domain-containing protein [Cobetia sp. 14N.309.X.WAT.E.A4]|uniref:PepSY-associated TM helix domain-containing protein n=1 Tax=Cobetia sp. 14N.309.X.WAT.E.A4 TaxID=2998323 RepID=UPI0025AFDCC3|nr:PepSY domain-containing protein [Cobetia sp. 14N.309.X.WAT.E.A4]MDN2656643.1 PepSY domain-containing protein [Cobetia sp. 14N.309.X.WAT.E.A4]
MKTATDTGTASRAGRGFSDIYRAVWRWHFYAGLLVLPFLVLLSVTGGLYLFRDGIDQFVHSDLMKVNTPVTQSAQNPAVTSLPLSEQVDQALASLPGTPVRVVPSPARDLTTEVDIVAADGSGKQAVYVNPYSGEVQGQMAYRDSIMWTVRRLHSLAITGPIGNAALEIAAGWSILLVFSGLYLWWPRGQKGGVVTLRATPARRLWWRDLHAVCGIIAAGFIVFLAVTGMPWSMVWGAKVNELANGHNYGYPDGVRVNTPMSDARLVDQELTSWSLEQAVIPLSSLPGDAADPIVDEGEHAGHGGSGASSAPVKAAVPLSAAAIAHADIGLDEAERIFAREGLAPGYAINLPSTAQGVYTGSVYPDALERQQVVHVDRYSGDVLLDMHYADYGPLGRALEWGINVHLGQQYGLINQLILLMACLAMVMMSVGAGVMWWKRRPVGGIGIPPLPRERKRIAGVWGLMMIIGVIFPLVGLSLIVMGLLDWLWIRVSASRHHDAAEASA